ncbi:hypothetical protein [Nisaea sp.]|uniref:hypothetical protein n=1 Tax=Nisaea sp. TaxID=2024842 RepID=UPI0032EF6953
MIINSNSLVAVAATVLAVFSMLVTNLANAANPQASIRHHWLKSDFRYQTKCVNEFYILVENLEPKDGNYKRSDFKILDMETKQEIPIQIVEGVGFGRTLEDPNNPGVTYKQYTNYELLGKIEPKTGKYEVSVAGHPAALATSVSEEAKDAKNNATSGKLNLAPLVGDGSATIGLKLDASYRLECLFDGMPYNFGGTVNLAGEFGADDGEEDFDRTFEAGVAFKYFLKPWAANKREYVNAFRISPLGIESDQEADKLNYVGKIEYATQIPYTDRIVEAFGASTDAGKRISSGHAAQILTGYTYAVELRDEIEDEEFEAANRWDTEIVWAFPLPYAFKAELRWKGFLDLEEGDFEERFLGTVRYPLAEGSGTDLVVSYRDGGEAPTFKDEQAIRVGLDIQFGSLSRLFF